MRPERYRFHCTDGRHAVIDRFGKRVSDPLLVWVHAERIAREMMASCSGHISWSAWIVDVHDSAGRRVGTLGFPEVRRFQQAA